MRRLLATGRRALTTSVARQKARGVEEGLGIHVVERNEQSSRARDATALQDYAELYAELSKVRRWVEREGSGTASTRRERNSGLPKSILEGINTKDGWFSPTGRQKTVQNYNKLIRALGAQGKISHALETLQDMQTNSGFVPSEFTLTAAVSACGKAKDESALEKVVDLTRKMTVLQEGRTFASQLGRVLRSAIASAYLQCDKRKEAMHFMQGEASLLNGHYYFGPSTEELEKIADDADVVTWTSLIKAHVDKGDHAFARRALEVMRIRGVEPDLVTFNVMISSAARSREINRALSLVSEMRAMGYQPDTYTYTSLAHGYAKIGNPEAARQVLQQAEKDGLIFNQDMTNVLLQAYAENGDYGSAEKVFEDLVNTFEVSYDLTIGCTILLAAYARHVRHRRARVGDRGHGDQNNLPTVATVDKEVNDRADKLINDMKALRLPFDSQLLNNYILVKTSSRRPERTREATKILFDEFERPPSDTSEIESSVGSKPKADLRTFGILIRSHGLLGDAEGVLSVLQEMKSQGVLPDGPLLLQAARACATGAMFHEALDIIVDAKSQGIKFELNDHTERPLRAILSLLRRADQRRIESVWRRVLLEDHGLDTRSLDKRRTISGSGVEQRRHLPGSLRGVRWWS